MMVILDPGIRITCAALRAGTDVTERWANPSQPALGAKMTFAAQPHTPSNDLLLFIILQERAAFWGPYRKRMRLLLGM